MRFAKNVGSHGTVSKPPNLAKLRFQDKIGSHGTIHTFKNYFTTIFSGINFQFSANKRYSIIPIFSIFATLISFFVTIIIDLQQSLPLPINFAVVASGLYLFPHIM